MWAPDMWSQKCCPSAGALALATRPVVPRSFAAGHTRPCQPLTSMNRAWLIAPALISERRMTPASFETRPR